MVPGNTCKPSSPDKKVSTETIAAFSDHNTGDDTYTVIPFLFHEAGLPTPPAQPTTITPVQSPTQPALLPFALIGAIVLVLGIVTWSRR